MQSAPAANTLCRMGINQRTESREDRMLGLQLGGATDGITRNISTTGVYFESNVSQALGDLIDFKIDFETQGGPLVLHCRGEVVRIEQHGTRMGAAVKILESKFEAPRERVSRY